MIINVTIAATKKAVLGQIQENEEELLIDAKVSAQDTNIAMLMVGANNAKLILEKTPTHYLRVRAQNLF